MQESRFTGGLLGLIGTYILVVILYICTLGIGLPWCVCIWQKWLADHTVIDGKQVVFDGTGGQLLGNYIKWYLLCIITLGIYSLWIWINIRKWVTKHTHLRG